MPLTCLHMIANIVTLIPQKLLIILIVDDSLIIYLKYYGSMKHRMIPL